LAQGVTAVNTPGRVNGGALIAVEAPVRQWVGVVVAAAGGSALRFTLGVTAVGSVAWVDGSALGWGWCWAWWTWWCWAWTWWWSSAGKWVRRLHGNTADAGGRDASRHHDVTGVTPRWPPRVLDNPCIGGVTDNEHTVIELGPARTREGAGCVMLETSLVGFDCNRDRSLCNGGSKLCFGVLWHIGEASNGTDLVGFLGSVARFVLFQVWIVGLGINTTVLDNVLEGEIHQPTLARMITFGGGAIHQLLFRERGERVACDLPGTFGRPSGRERPA